MVVSRVHFHKNNDRFFQWSIQQTQNRFIKPSFVLGLLDKLIPALGAGDADLALAPGHPDRGMALGAAEVPVDLPILPASLQAAEPAQDLVLADEVLIVLLGPLLGLLGQGPKDAQNEQRPGQGHQHRADDQGGLVLDAGEQKAQQQQHPAAQGQEPVQLVRPVAALHKLAQAFLHPVHLSIRPSR